MNEILETLPPETKIVDDPTLNVGTEVNEGGGMTGYRASAYQVTYENGVEVNREKVSTDTYTKVDVIIKKGTKPVTPPEPEVKPEDEAGETAPEDQLPEVTPSTPEQTVPQQ